MGLEAKQLEVEVEKQMVLLDQIDELRVLAEIFAVSRTVERLGHQITFAA